MHAIRYAFGMKGVDVRNSNMIFRILVGLIGGAMTPSLVTASPVEASVDLLVVSEPVDVAYGTHTENADLDATTDIDGFKFNGTAGDTVRIVVAGQANNLDPRIELRDSIGTVIDAVSCSASSIVRCSVSLTETLLTSGMHFINVSDSGVDNSGAYTFHIERIGVSTNWVGLALDETVSQTLGHLGDHDLYAFDAAAGTGMRISLDGTTNNLDGRIQVWDPTGGLVADSSCNASSIVSCSVVTDINPALDGIYRLAVFDSGFNNNGTYNLAVNCVFGACPPGPPVPLPGALPLVGSGAAALYALVRVRRRRPEG